MAIIDTIEYSVCEDCLVSIAHGCNDSTSVADDDHLEARMKAELCGREGHFVAGVEPTEDDEEGTGHEEFSWSSCELCNDTRGGSRHGVTLLIEDGGTDGQKAEQDGLSPPAVTAYAATAESPAADPAAVIPPTDQGA